MSDRISLAFHIIGCIVLLRSIRLLCTQRLVHGVSLWHAGFFASWSCWNLYFYHDLGLYYTWCGAVVMAVLNCTWVVLLCYYKLEEYGEQIEKDIAEWKRQDKFCREEFSEEKERGHA